MSFNIKNYTSGVPVSRTIARIEEILADAGVQGISKDYKDGKLLALSFRVVLHAEKPVAIRLPANVQAVYDVMKASVKRPRRGTLEKLQDQAERTSWKLMQDWVEVQISLIKMQQADFLQVFLPYVWDGEKDFYHALKAKQFLALPAPPP